MVLVALVHTDSSLGATPYLGWKTSPACLFLKMDFPQCVMLNLFLSLANLSKVLSHFYLMADSAYLKS